MNQQPSLMKTVLFTVARVTGFMLAFFLLGGPYYIILDNMYGTATDQGITALTTWSYTIYWVFYYGFPSVIVLGILGSIVYAVLVVRKRYFATEEAYY